MEKKNIVFIVLSVFLSAIISGGGVLLWKNKLNRENLENTKQDMQEQIDALQIILGKSVDLDLLQPIKMSWLREDGKKMCLDGRILFNTGFKELSSIEEENAKYEALFQQAGFVKNEANTNIEGKPNVLDPSIGFEKGNLQCVISWDGEEKYETQTYWYRVLCAEHTAEDDANFDAFYSVINPNGSEEMNVCVDKKNDNFAVGTFNLYRSGARWFASKQDGEWVFDLGTQDYPPCSLVKDYPEDFYMDFFGRCWEDWTLYKNENYGFEVNYPKNWQISELPDLKAGFLLEPKSGQDKIYLSKTKNDGDLSIIELIDTFNDTSRFWPQEFPYENTTINGKEAVVFDYIKEGEQERKEVFIKVNGYVFVASYFYEEKNEDAENIFDQIVEEIKFVGELK